LPTLPDRDFFTTMAYITDLTHPFVGRRVAKFFNGVIFFGLVIYKSEYFRVEYDDGDAEDFDESELLDLFFVYMDYITHVIDLTEEEE
jgi:hypothetical protein